MEKMQKVTSELSFQIISDGDKLRAINDYLADTAKNLVEIDEYENINEFLEDVKHVCRDIQMIDDDKMEVLNDVKNTINSLITEFVNSNYTNSSICLNINDKSIKFEVHK